MKTKANNAIRPPRAAQLSIHTKEKMNLFHFVWVEIGEDPGTAEATMEGLAFPSRPLSFFKQPFRGGFRL
jgi:hypothetical protein